MKTLSLSNKLKAKQIYSTIIILIFLGLILGLGSVDNKTENVYHQSQWNQYAPEIERAIKDESLVKPLNLKHIYGMVLSHHIPTTIPKLVDFYQRLKATQAVSNFIVIGPDHTDAGKSTLTSSNASFFTTYGEVKPIDGLAVKLQAKGLVQIDESPFELEHSIGSQVLIISKIFPGAKITPIIFRSDVNNDQAENLGKELTKIIDDKTVLVASVDFSHYLATNQALPIDQISGEVVRNLDLDAFSMIRADSSKSMETFMWVMKGKGATSTDDFSVSNTNDLMQNSDYTTGYVFGFWGI